ncbi:MAG TPA: TolC family protein [Pyrinomonadaceae bacterium]|jgi:HAE1 family hydrophobic/amphiphilic exporter-1|nr:TolC family protein [Pyrinomonadaceae bacterium]
MNLSRLKSPIYSLAAVCLLSGAAFSQTSTESADKPDSSQTAQLIGFAATGRLAPSRVQAYTPSNMNRVGVQTAQPLPLSLADAIRKALESNNDIEVSRDDVRFQQTRVRGLEGIYDPILTISPTFTHNSNTGSVATKDFRLNAGLNQFIRPGGGSISSFFNNQRTENAFSQAQVTSGTVSSGNGALFSSTLGVTYTQPLFRNFSIDARRHSIIVAKKNLEQTDSDFRLNATTTITNVQRAYWDFVFSLRNQQNQVANVNLAKENLRQIEAKIDAGAAAPLERAEVATELANREGDLLLATQQVSISENSLKQLVLRDPLSVEWSQTYVPTDPPAFSLDTLSLDDAMKDAMDNRFELRRLKLQQEINAADIKYYKNQTKPQIDLNTTFSLDGLSSAGSSTATTTNLLTNSQDLFLLNSLNATRQSVLLPTIANPSLTIPASPPFLFGGFNRSIANLFRSDAPNYAVGVTISFPFRNRTAKANLDGARIQEHQLDAQVRGQENTVVVEVRNAVQAVETSRQRVLTARTARENAEVQLQGEQKLYEAGKSTTFLLFQRENALTNARNAEIRAETDYNKSIADLQRATSTAFRANNIQVASPLDQK